MAPNPIVVPRERASNTLAKDHSASAKAIGFSTPLLYTAIVVLLVAAFPWARRWLFSGAAALSLLILFGAANGSRILPFVHLWTLLATLNLAYSIASTSWLLHCVFVTACYPAIFLTCLFQFCLVSNFVRGHLRSILKQLQFTNDKVAYFDIPALEIDTDVDGLFVVRGLTVSLSSLTIVAHGVELAIKFSDDMEFAINVETVTIPLFRRIEIGDVYGNLKGGKHEMTFGDVDARNGAMNEDEVFLADTPLLRAATGNSDALEPPRPTIPGPTRPPNTEMEDIPPKAVFDSVTQLSPDDEKASKQYRDTLQWIQESGEIHICQKEVRRNIIEKGLGIKDEKDIRAAVCARLHTMASVPHPPKRSIKVTTLQTLMPPYVREFLHRLPMLLRLLLAPLSYFHPVTISSITAAGSGQWISTMIDQNIFQDFADQDAEIRRLERKISAWLANANFAIQMVDIAGLAQIPFVSNFDIVAYLGFGDVMAYRTMPEASALTQIVRLGGADATFTVPSFLLPHHEHILPHVPSAEDKEELSNEIGAADGKPKTIQAEHELEKAQKDQCNVKMSVHASLPACFDQELLNFVAALVKATKVVEMEKEPNALDEEVRGFKDFTRNLHRATKDHMKRVAVDGIVNDKWIAKMVGKIAKKFETAQGDLGYSGDIPVPLAPYRPAPDLPSKLLA